MSSAMAMAATSHAADRLAAYAAALRYEHVPADIVGTAKTCLIDAALRDLRRAVPVVARHRPPSSPHPVRRARARYRA